MYSGGRGTADSMLVKRGTHDSTSRVAVYPMPVPSSSSNCSHDKGHLYASFGAHSPAQGHKRLAQCSVGGLNLGERGGGGAYGNHRVFNMAPEQNLHSHLPLLWPSPALQVAP